MGLRTGPAPLQPLRWRSFVKREGPAPPYPSFSRWTALALKPSEAHPQSPAHPGFFRRATERTMSQDAAAATIRRAAAVWSWGDMMGQNPRAVPDWYTMNEIIQAAPVM